MSGSYTSVVIADSNVVADRTISTEYTSSGALYQNFDKSIIALTYDLGDLATLSLGFNLQRKLFFGISLDASTPISEFVGTFRGELKNMRNFSALGTGN